MDIIINVILCPNISILDLWSTFILMSVIPLKRYDVIQNILCSANLNGDIILESTLWDREKTQEGMHQT